MRHRRTEMITYLTKGKESKKVCRMHVETPQQIDPRQERKETPGVAPWATWFVQTGCSRLTSWSATTITPGNHQDQARLTGPGLSSWGTLWGRSTPHREAPAPAVTPTHQGPTNAACHSPSGGPSISPHPGGSGEAGPCPALNKDILTFASGFSAATV